MNKTNQKMKISDKFTIATFISIIPVGITMWLLYVYQSEELWYLMAICLAIFFFLGLAAHIAEENDPTPLFYL